MMKTMSKASTISRADKHINIYMHIRMWEIHSWKSTRATNLPYYFEPIWFPDKMTLIVSPIVLLSLVHSHKSLLQSVRLMNLGGKLDWLKITDMVTLTSMNWRLCCWTMARALGWEDNHHKRQPKETILLCGIQCLDGSISANNIDLMKNLLPWNTMQKDYLFELAHFSGKPL